MLLCPMAGLGFWGVEAQKVYILAERERGGGREREEEKRGGKMCILLIYKSTHIYM